jgi:diguanylate cyclase (GGDEF)-like protein
MQPATQEQIYYRPNSYISLRKRLRGMTQRVNPQDIISTRYHSRDFKTSRSEYISVRIRTLALIFALLAPLWIPIDYFVMQNPTFTYIVLLRLGFSLALFSLSHWGTNCNLLFAAHFRTLLFILIPCLFFLATNLMLHDSNTEQGILLGYSFLPFLIMALLTIVPLTLLEGLLATGLIIAFYLITKLLQGNLFSISALGDLWLLLLLAAIALWVQVTQLHMLMRLYREATRDALTGLVNRRILSTKLTQEISHGDSNLCVLLFDLDLFKRINDNYGHHTGDTVLQAFSEILKQHCNEKEVVGRYGGEEFLAVLPQTDVEAARELAERIRLACHRYKIYTSDGGKEVTFTTSIGVAKRKPNESAPELLSRVDQGLYTAKAGGRDLVSIAE